MDNWVKREQYFVVAKVDLSFSSKKLTKLLLQWKLGDLTFAFTLSHLPAIYAQKASLGLAHIG